MPEAPTLTLFSPAKINLWLHSLKRRPDGFHDLQTRMSPLELADVVSLAPSADGKAMLTCSDESLPVDESNLAMKALRGFERASGLTCGWHIHLEKHIPHGAGLGGGSSNAAAVLRGLNTLHREPLSKAALHDIAAQLGSDVPFFLYGRTCDASGRGEVITPVDNYGWELPIVLIKPAFGISTPWAYQQWAGSKELAGVKYDAQCCNWGQMVNELERPVFEKWLWLPAMKMWLLEQAECAAALMSGSGSTMLAVAHDAATAQSLAAKTRAYCGDNTWVHVTHTVG